MPECTADLVMRCTGCLCWLSGFLCLYSDPLFWLSDHLFFISRNKFLDELSPHLNVLYSHLKSRLLRADAGSFHPALELRERRPRARAAHQPRRHRGSPVVPFPDAYLRHVHPHRLALQAASRSLPVIIVFKKPG